MVVLNECRIDYEGKCVIIEATVDSLDYYKDVYIESITIDSNDTYTQNGPSSNPVFSMDLSTENADNGGVKHIRVALSSKDLKLDTLGDKILFIYIGTTGYPMPDTPCGMDPCYVMGVAVNWKSVYNVGMKHMSELKSNCSIPRGFIDFILRVKALQLSLKTGNFKTAIEYWNKFSLLKESVPSNKCGCYGTS